MPDSSIWDDEENRETRMPKVDGVPITEGLSERGSKAEGASKEVVVRAARDVAGSTPVPEVPLSESSSDLGSTVPPRRRAQGCSAYAPAGTKCKLCGKVHTQSGAAGVAAPSAIGRAQGGGARVSAPVKTDFKKKKEKK